jgi:cytochrome c biogenesis protein CcmG, thiol:disulfide interchange protein DsbE
MSVASEERPLPRPSTLRKLLRFVAIAVVVLFVALLAYGLTKSAPDDSIDQRLRSRKNAPAPGFSLEVLEPGVLPVRLGKVKPLFADGHLSLKELRGTPVVLNFWASWCNPCREEAPRLQKGWERWGKRDVLLLGLDMQDIRSDARDFLRDFDITYPTIRDPGKEVSRRYGATGIPETYFISAKSKVVGHVVGVVSAEQLESGITAARAGRPAGAKRGGARRPPR